MPLRDLRVRRDRGRYLRVIGILRIFEIKHEIGPHPVFRQFDILFRHIQGKKNAAGYAAAGIFSVVFQAAEHRAFTGKTQNIDEGLVLLCKAYALICAVHLSGFENIQHLSGLVCYDFDKNSSLSIHRRPVE